jgi:hypothetical protein
VESAAHKYWRSQAYPVWLVIRITDEWSGPSIRRMDLSAYLKRESERRKTPIKQVEFRGEPLTAQPLMALRDRIVPPRSGETMPSGGATLERRRRGGAAASVSGEDAEPGGIRYNDMGG